MDEELAGGFGNVEVIFKEALNGHQRFAVKRFETALLEHFVHEHFAQRRRQLINESADTEIFIGDDILFGVEDLADFNGGLRFLIRTCQILDGRNCRTDTDGNFCIEFRVDGICNLLCHLFYFADFEVGLDFLDQDNIMLADIDDKILVLIREHILNDIERNDIDLAVELDQNGDTHDFRGEMQLLGLDVNIAGKNVVKDDVLDERALVVLFIVQILDVGQRNRKNHCKLFRLLVFTLDKNDVFILGRAADRTVGITAGNHGIRRICHFVADTLSGFSDFDKLAAGNNDTVFIDDTNHAFHCFSHLMNNTLEQSGRHMVLPPKICSTAV